MSPLLIVFYNKFIKLQQIPHSMFRKIDLCLDSFRFQGVEIYDA